MENPRQTQEEHSGRRRRVVFFPLPFQGHLNPMLQLGSILHSRGVSISIIHTKLFTTLNPSEHPNFNFHSISDGLSEAEASMTDFPALVSTLNVTCVAPFRDCLGRLLADASPAEPVTCLISDAVLYFTQGVADGLKLRRVVLRTSSASSFVAFAAFPLLREKGYLPVQDSQLEEPLPELEPLRVKDLPLIKTQNPDTIYELVDGMINGSKASAGLIWNSFEELEQSALATISRSLGIPAFPVGPFHKYFPPSSSILLTGDPTAITWLDTQAPRSVIYVSYGSIASMAAAEFLEMAWGLANSRQPFLLVIRPGLIHGAEWLETLPGGFFDEVGERGHIVKWAPQLEVLAHPSVGAFCTHSGWNSTLESISEGVPMICLPCFTDQKVNARYVSHVWRVGEQLEKGFERGEIERAIRRVMGEKGGGKMRERIEQLKEKAILCVRPGGSSSRNLESLIRLISSN